MYQCMHSEIHKLSRMISKFNFFFMKEGNNIFIQSIIKIAVTIIIRLLLVLIEILVYRSYFETIRLHNSLTKGKPHFLQLLY